MTSSRTKYIIKHKKMFHNIGNKIFWQPRNLPDEPELLGFGNNVKIAANVTFVTHDILHFLYTDMDQNLHISPYKGIISIGNNVALEQILL